MKRRTMVKRVAVAAMTGSMVMSMTAFAAEKSAGTIQKIVTVPENSSVPQTSFSFTITEASADEVENGRIIAYKGKANGLYFKGENDAAVKTGSISFLGENQLNSAVNGIQSTNPKTLGMYVDTTQFKENSAYKPGVYKYHVSEVSGAYAGMDYSKVEYDVYVTLVWNEDYTDLDVLGVKFVEVVNESGQSIVGDKTKKANMAEFKNVYGTGTNKVYDLTFKKSVTGNQGNKGGTYKFGIQITPDEENEKFTVIYKQSANGEEKKITLDNTNNYTVKVEDADAIGLSDTGSFVIYGLSSGDAYTVEEESYAADGYTTYIYEEGAYGEGASEGKPERSVLTNLKNGEVEPVAKDTIYTVENNKNAGAATGVAMTFAPYVLMLGAAGVAGGMFLRKKKEDF